MRKIFVVFIMLSCWGGNFYGMGQSPIHLFAQHGAVEELNGLIESGTNVDERDEVGRTALHGAAYFGHVNAAKVLLGNGADKNALDSRGNTPLHIAFECFDVAKYLLKKGADLNARNSNGRTPLHEALKWRDDEVAHLFIEQTANQRIRDNDGLTPVDILIQDFWNPNECICMRDSCGCRSDFNMRWEHLLYWFISVWDDCDIPDSIVQDASMD